MATKDLTEEQKQKLIEYRDRWIIVGTNCDPINPELAVAAIDKMYKCSKLPVPKWHFFFKSPIDVLYAAYICDKYKNIENDKEKMTQEFFDEEIKKLKQNPAIKKELHTYFQYFTYGNHEAVWLSFYDFFNQETEVDLSEIEGLVDVAHQCGWGIYLDLVSLVSEKPREIHLDEQNRLHNTTGPALAFRDGFEIYCIKNITIEDPTIITNPESITAEKVDAQQNAEIKRIMIELMGKENYIQQGNFKIMDDDPEFGVLYKKEIQGDPEPLVMVKVINSTPEHDENGNLHNKEYWLRVDPKCKTAKDAVAWTFVDPKDKTSEVKQYAPDAES